MAVDCSSPRGRPPSTSREAVERVALELFTSRGFAGTTMVEVAHAVGVSRRTLFRYYPTKNDLVWGDFALVLDRLRGLLAETPAGAPLMRTLSTAIIASNRYPAEQLPLLRTRMRLITQVPELQSHATLRYASWRAVVAAFVAERRGEASEALVPQTIGFVTLGASMAAFSRWVDHPDDDLDSNLARAFGTLDGSLAATERAGLSGSRAADSRPSPDSSGGVDRAAVGRQPRTVRSPRGTAAAESTSE